MRHLQGSGWREARDVLACVKWRMPAFPAPGSAFSVIVPRIGDADGIIHFRAVAKRTSAKQFANDVLGTSESEMFEAQTAYCYELARTCARKYRWLDRSLFTGVLGYAAFLVTLVFL